MEHHVVRLRETEDGFQRAVIELASAFGWICHHTRPARTSTGWRTPIQGTAGFPDLVLVKADEALIIAELKSERGKTSAAQDWWIHLLGMTTSQIEVYVWRPSDFEAIRQRLRGHRGKCLALTKGGAME